MDLDPTIIYDPLVDDLMAFSGDKYYLNEPGWANYPDDHDDQGDDKTAYVHFRKNNGLYFIQYYFFYYYNDGANNHEGDLEMVQISFEKKDSGYFPLRATYSQHTDFPIANFNFGEKRDWINVEKYIDANSKLTNHPIVYVSSGTGIDSEANSHANYFYKGDYGSIPDWTADCTMKIEFLSDDLVILPNLEDILSDQKWTDYSWLQFAGNWGECGAEVFDAPPGPVFCTFENSDIGDDTTYLRWIDVNEFEEGRLYDGGHNEISFEYPTIDVNDKSVGMRNAVTLEAYLKDESQNSISNQMLSFYVDGEFQENGQTNSEGYASIIYHDTTVPGDHEIQVVFKGQNDGNPDHAWCDEKATLTISTSGQTEDGASTFITSSLEITQSSPFYVGDTLTAQFAIKNKGTSSIIFDVLTVGGRDPDDKVADFTFRYGIPLGPSESYSYEGNLTLTKTGNYHFFCAYKIPNGIWNPAIPTESGVTNVIDIISLAGTGDGSDISDGGEDSDGFFKDLFEPIEGIPGFELIILVAAIAVVILWRRKQD